MRKDKMKNWLQGLFLGGVVGITCIFVYKNIKVIISYCNTNEGFFSALLGFLAILISVLTYYNQKKEQTKNAQESANLQKELAIRQIKLDTFKIRIEYWKKVIEWYQFIKEIEKINIQYEINSLSKIIFHYQKEMEFFPDYSLNLRELLFILDCEERVIHNIELLEKAYKQFNYNYRELCNGVTFTVSTSSKYANYNIKNPENYFKNLQESLETINQLFPSIINSLEKNIDIVKIDSI